MKPLNRKSTDRSRREFLAKTAIVGGVSIIGSLTGVSFNALSATDELSAAQDGTISKLGVAKKAQLTIMETSDLHMNLIGYDYYSDRPVSTIGLDRTASLIAQMRKEFKNTMLVDDGDLLQGNPLGDYIARVQKLDNGQIHPAYKAMNLLQYDVATLGNHDFNYGLDFLQKAIKTANFPYISSNVVIDDGKGNLDPSHDQFLVKSYLIIDKEVITDDGKKGIVKVGFMGFAPPQITQWDAANLKGKVKAYDIIDTAKRMVVELKKQGAEIVIALSHSGAQSDGRKGMDENASYYLTLIPGIDAVFMGHEHKVCPSNQYAHLTNADMVNGTINKIPAVMPGYGGNHLGYINLELENHDGAWHVVSGTAHTRAIFKKEGKQTIALVEPDQTLVDAVQKEHEATIAYMNQKVGETSAPIFSYFALVADDPSIQIVNAAQIAYVKKLIKGTEYEQLPVLSAGAPFKAGGRGGADYYTNIPKGPLALKNVADLYVYPNTVDIVKLTGAQVIEWLEMSALAFNQIDPTKKEQQNLLDIDFPSYNFDVIDGITYQIDVTKPPRYNKEGDLINPNAHRIVQVQFNDKPIDLTASFLVATNNYRGSGGGHFPALDGTTVVIAAPDENRTALSNYLQDQKEINPTADNNWRFVDNLKGAYVTFETGSNAKQHLNDQYPFVYDKDLADGFIQMKFK